MAADHEALQGSLFRDDADVIESPKTHSSVNISPPKKIDFSDEELAEDAQNRPRTRQKRTYKDNPPATENVETDLESNEDDLPAWSNHQLVDPEQLTPMLRHYVELKSTHPERILLYRLGDFFECFFEDAIAISRLLELTLTGKEGGKAIGRVPMAGIPHHAAERYCKELILRGLSIAICDQLETTPAKGGLLKREITRILTPGTVLEEGMLTASRNNWLAAVVIETIPDNQSFIWGLAHADISTGDFLVTEGRGESSLQQELAQLEASELLLSKSTATSFKDLFPRKLRITEMGNTPFSLAEAERGLKNHYQLTTLDGLGLQDLQLALKAAGGLLNYLYETNPIDFEESSSHNSISIPLDRPRKTYAKDCLVIDAQTRRNLEITTTQRDGQLQGSLLWAIDQTLTAMGGRCLRRWLEKPLVDLQEIHCRQALISKLVENRQLRNSIRRLMRPMGDLERLAGRARAGHSGGRDLMAIADGLDRIPRLAKQIESLLNCAPEWTKNLKNINPDLLKLEKIIRDQLIDNPPLSITDGGLINDGVDPILDGLRNQLDDQNNWLNRQESLERQTSGISNLRLQYHRTFGYFLSVSKAKASNVPEHWIRRQTLANEERFITPELKAREGQIFQSRARAAQREYELFCQLRELVGTHADALRKAARAVAGLDALSGLAEVAATNGYCCPEIFGAHEQNSRELNIQGCRHPVVEQLLVEETFRPNDLQIGNKTDLIVLTGPNASGKSCYLRQVGLVQLLAQIGSWVPATKASIGIADQIFTRVGAVDDLASGQSTFMVEMAETAYILNHATNRSLVLLDEIGRGTATFDGLSIAWAVSEHLANNLRSRTIFATHYHELNTLAEHLSNVANFQVLVEETGKELLFLHSVVPGGASRSYGIEAARLAGVPTNVVKRARNVLKALQNDDHLQQPIRIDQLSTQESLH